MKITLKKLSLINFKGIKDKVIDFTENTNIFGANASGKTTFFDAFTWLLFGKDSTDRKEFEIKTIGLHKADHEVIGVLDIDGVETTLRRAYKEKWVVKRGESESVFSGHETTYSINEVPFNQKEYQAKIAEIIDESIFKLVTSPTYFNQTMKWQDRREILFQMAGTISDQEIAETREEFMTLLSSLNGKSLEEFKREIASKKKLLKDELKEKPSRIAEVNHNIPEKLDFNAIGKELEERKQELAKIESSILNASQAYQAEVDKIQLKKDEVYKLKSRLGEFETKAKLKIQEENQSGALETSKITNEIESLNQEIASLGIDKKSTEGKISELKTKKDSLLKNWHTENGKELAFNEDEFSCAACKRPFETDDIEAKKAELKENFNQHKVSVLASISKDGKETANHIETLEKFFAVQEEKIAKALVQLNEKKEALTKLEEKTSKPRGSVSVEFILSKDPNYNFLKDEITQKENAIPELPQVDNSALLEQKGNLGSKIDSLKAQLTVKDTITKAETRIKELEEEEKELAQQVADLEKLEFTIDKFNKVKIEAIESKVNSMFEYVTFKMFNEQINGGESETCDTLINGVPYSDANNAAKINAGIDCLNAIGQHHNIMAPVFVDNAEGINSLLYTGSQVVNLYVIPEEPKDLKEAADYKDYYTSKGVLLTPIYQEQEAPELVEA